MIQDLILAFAFVAIIVAPTLIASPSSKRKRGSSRSGPSAAVPSGLPVGHTLQERAFTDKMIWPERVSTRFSDQI